MDIQYIYFTKWPGCREYDKIALTRCSINFQTKHKSSKQPWVRQIATGFTIDSYYDVVVWCYICFGSVILSALSEYYDKQGREESTDRYLGRPPSYHWAHVTKSPFFSLFLSYCVLGICLVGLAHPSGINNTSGGNLSFFFLFSFLLGANEGFRHCWHQSGQKP